MTRFTTTLSVLIGASLGLAACTSDLDPPPTDDPKPDPNSTAGGDGTSFDHPNDGPSVWDLLDRLTTQGPQTFTSQMHACAKLQYSSLGTLLTSLGVNVGNNATGSAGALYRASTSSLGTPNYANRIRENIAITTSGSSSLFDIFAAAAPEIITAFPSLERCKVAGVSPPLFDSLGCHAESISCLIGTKAQPAHVDICNKTLTGATTPTIGQQLAVATLLAAAFICE